MENFLRKVCKLSTSHGGHHRSSSNQKSYSQSQSQSHPADRFQEEDRQQMLMYLHMSSTGDFDRIPVDIFVQIVKYLGPKESAKLSTVCKSWKFIIADDQRLWNQEQEDPPTMDSIFFAETHLRFGFPFPTSKTQLSELSFMQIYAQRAQVPGAIIIDGGSGYCKFGWSKYWLPFGRSPTLEFGSIESPMYSKLRRFFSNIYSRMQVKPSTQPIVLSLPISHCDDTESGIAARRQLKDAIYSALFDMNVPAVCAVNQAVLALFAARQVSGIVVNIGFNQTSIVPVLNGRVMHSVGVEFVGMGALKLTEFLREKMQQQDMIFASLSTARTLKENLCYVALDYKAELRKDTEASFKVTDEGLFTLSKERFQTGEILFQPRMAGVLTMGLHKAVALCMDHCHDAELTADNSWFKHIVLAGGSACLPGLAERLQKELNEILPLSMSTGVKVVPPPYGIDSAWFGAKLISNLSTFPHSWCVTKKQHRRRNMIC